MNVITYYRNSRTFNGWVVNQFIYGEVKDKVRI